LEIIASRIRDTFTSPFSVNKMFAAAKLTSNSLNYRANKKIEVHDYKISKYGRRKVASKYSINKEKSVTVDTFNVSMNFSFSM